MRGVSSAYPGYKPARREKDTAVVMLAPRFRYTEATEWLTGTAPARMADGNMSLVVPPGDIRIVEFAIEGD